MCVSYLHLSTTNEAEVSFSSCLRIEVILLIKGATHKKSVLRFIIFQMAKKMSKSSFNFILFRFYLLGLDLVMRLKCTQKQQAKKTRRQALA